MGNVELGTNLGNTEPTFGGNVAKYQRYGAENYEIDFAYGEMLIRVFPFINDSVYLGGELF